MNVYDKLKQKLEELGVAPETLIITFDEREAKFQWEPCIKTQQLNRPQRMIAQRSLSGPNLVFLPTGLGKAGTLFTLADVAEHPDQFRYRVFLRRSTIWKTVVRITHLRTCRTPIEQSVGGVLELNQNPIIWLFKSSVQTGLKDVRIFWK